MKKIRKLGQEELIFFVEEKIMVELKAHIKLEDVHLAQTRNYLEAYKMQIGLLINFGSKSLEFKRLHNNKLIKAMSKACPCIESNVGGIPELLDQSVIYRKENINQLMNIYL